MRANGAARMAACVLTAFALAQPRGAQPDTVSCEGTSVSVLAGDGRDAVDMCRGAEAAARFFRSNRQARATPIRLEVVDRLPLEGSRAAVGCFSRADRQAYALSCRTLAQRGMWLGLPVSREICASIPVHEIAHALTACNAVGFPLSLHATEYVAFVANIDEFVRAFDPIRFGVGSCRRLLSEENEPAFLDDPMSGHRIGPTVTRQRAVAIAVSIPGRSRGHVHAAPKARNGP